MYLAYTDHISPENNATHERCLHFEILRGRDGRDGCDEEMTSRQGWQKWTGEKGEKSDMGEQGPPGPSSGGVTYIRWGRTTCPNTTGTELVYKGRAAGSFGLIRVVVDCHF